MPTLDGTEKLAHTPFDALDKQVQSSDPKGHHDEAGNWIPDAEFPKAVDHEPHPDPIAAAAGQKEPVVVESSAEERDFLRKEVEKLKAGTAVLQAKIEALAAAAKDAAEKAVELEGSEAN